MDKMESGSRRLFPKVTRSNLPQVKDKYPFLYFERARLEVDGHSVKVVDSMGEVIPLPIATIASILLGPGTSITHECVKVMASSNCTVSWVGEDAMLFYAVGHTPTSDTRNMRAQLKLSSDKKKSVEIARWMFSKRLSTDSLEGKSISEMMGLEGFRVKKIYEEMSNKYDVHWDGRKYKPGEFAAGSITNQILTAANAALYGLVTSVIYSVGMSPQIGFIHSGSPLPLVYDIADFYKEQHCIDLAFSLTKIMAGFYDRRIALDEFRKRVVQEGLLGKMTSDCLKILDF